MRLFALDEARILFERDENIGMAVNGWLRTNLALMTSNAECLGVGDGHAARIHFVHQCENDWKLKSQKCSTCSSPHMHDTRQMTESQRFVANNQWHVPTIQSLWHFNLWASSSPFCGSDNQHSNQMKQKVKLLYKISSPSSESVWIQVVKFNLNYV